jgi:hypothetical protein
MRLKVKEPGKGERMVDGPDARMVLKSLLRDLSQSILIPEPPFTGIMRRRVVDTLKQGRPVWSNPNHNGQVSDKSTVVAMVPKIVGIIRADGTWDGEGPDPRLAKDGVVGEAGAGDGSPPLLAPKP